MLPFVQCLTEATGISKATNSTKCLGSVQLGLINDFIQLSNAFIMISRLTFKQCSVFHFMLFVNISIVPFYRFHPPQNICPNGRKKATLPKEATNVLRNWLDNSPRPYPTRETKAALAEVTGLTTMQASLKIIYDPCP